PVPVDEVSMPPSAPEPIDHEVRAEPESLTAAREPEPPLPPAQFLKAPANAQQEQLRRTIGEVNVERAAESLIAGGATRAVFVSPEGDEGAAASVLVAREIADAGLRVVLLDLTASGAASRPMLESDVYTGITNLLVSEAQFADVIHT